MVFWTGVINEVGLNAAIFAPGWTFEVGSGRVEPTAFELAEKKLWYGYDFVDLMEFGDEVVSGRQNQHRVTWKLVEKGQGWEARPTSDGRYGGSPNTVVSKFHLRSVVVSSYAMSTRTAVFNVSEVRYYSKRKRVGSELNCIFYMTAPFSQVCGPRATYH
jgi:hypothetical protein